MLEGPEGLAKESQGPFDGQLREDKYGGMDRQTEFLPVLRRGPGVAGGGCSTPRKWQGRTNWKDLMFDGSKGLFSTFPKKMQLSKIWLSQ